MPYGRLPSGIRSRTHLETMLVPNDGLCRKVPRALYIVCGESAARMVARKNSVSNPGTGYSLIFFHSCEIKFGGGLGTRLWLLQSQGVYYTTKGHSLSCIRIHYDCKFPIPYSLLTANYGTYGKCMHVVQQMNLPK